MKSQPNTLQFKPNVKIRNRIICEVVFINVTPGITKLDQEACMTVFKAIFMQNH